MSHYRRYICENIRCLGDGLTEEMTHEEYERRASFNRLVYCPSCALVEPPRRLVASGRAISVSRLTLFRERFR